MVITTANGDEVAVLNDADLGGLDGDFILQVKNNSTGEAIIAGVRLTHEDAQAVIDGFDR